MRDQIEEFKILLFQEFNFAYQCCESSEHFSVNGISRGITAVGSLLFANEPHCENSCKNVTFFQTMQRTLKCCLYHMRGGDNSAKDIAFYASVETKYAKFLIPSSIVLARKLVSCSARRFGPYDKASASSWLSFYRNQQDGVHERTWKDKTEWIWVGSFRHHQEDVHHLNGLRWISHLGRLASQAVKGVSLGATTSN